VAAFHMVPGFPINNLIISFFTFSQKSAPGCMR
jgi:hypothetical protein